MGNHQTELADAMAEAGMNNVVKNILQVFQIEKYFFPFWTL